jgi:ABC-type multidrug transport system fused ATPase/permease subunit
MEIMNYSKVSNNKSKKINWLYRANNLGLTYRSTGIFITLALISTVTEIFGIGIFLPIFEYISLDGDLDALAKKSSLWKYIIDLFIFFNIKPSLIVLLVVSFSFFLCKQLATYIRLVYSSVVRERIVQKQRNHIFNSYIKADSSYHDKIPVGSLVSIITTEVTSAVSGVMAPMQLIVYLVMMFGYLITLFILSWEMTLSSTIVLLIASRIPNGWINESANVGRKLVGINTQTLEFLVGRLKSPRLVRLSGTEMAEKHEYHSLTQKQRKHVILTSILQIKTDTTMEPIIVGLSLIFLYFSYTVLNLQMEIIGIYLFIVMRLIPIVKGCVSQWQTVQRFIGSIEIVENRLKDMKNHSEKDCGINNLEQLKHLILIDNVSYKYPTSNDKVLKDITINLKVNTMTAIVGPSGSGKSTLIDLLPNLRSPTKGLIYFDGINVDKFTLKSVRNLISYAPQSPQIFSGTIKEHILYGKTRATDEEIQIALHMSGSKEFVNRLPQGLDTVLGEDAIKLSGGQRQRLDLARVLIKKAPILILDEPNSNLDIESEKIFNGVVSRIRKDGNTTIIIISHKLTSISNADNIVVLNNGRVEESGTHSELIIKNGWYCTAWNNSNAHYNTPTN